MFSDSSDGMAAAENAEAVMLVVDVAPDVCKPTKDAVPDIDALAIVVEVVEVINVVVCTDVVVVVVVVMVVVLVARVNYQANIVVLRKRVLAGHLRLRLPLLMPLYSYNMNNFQLFALTN